MAKAKHKIVKRLAFRIRWELSDILMISHGTERLTVVEVQKLRHTSFLNEGVLYK